MKLYSLKKIINKIAFIIETIVSLFKLMLLSFIKEDKALPNKTFGIVFSKDRPLQLKSLIDSFILNKKGQCELIVIFSSSGIEYLKAYEELIGMYKDEVSLRFVHQSQDLKPLLVKTLKHIKGSRVFFLVDDIIFIRNVDFDKLKKIDLKKKIFSLRMGKNLNYSLMSNSIQPLPDFFKEDEFKIWDWKKSSYDWNYIISLDGHFFHKSEILKFIKSVNFKAPNSLEHKLQIFKFLFRKRLGVCYEYSSIVNFPFNRVQDEFDNSFGNYHQDFLLSQWKKKRYIDISVFQDFLNNSVHQEVKIKFLGDK